MKAKSIKPSEDVMRGMYKQGAIDHAKGSLYDANGSFSLFLLVLHQT